MKKCGHCERELSLDCFQKNRSAPDGLQYICKDCSREASKRCRERRKHLWLQTISPWKNRSDKNREQSNARARERRKRNPEKHREAQKQYGLKTKYGISVDLKLALIQAQGGICAICPKEIDFSCATDHHHKKNFMRGMLCKQCNSALGLFKDSSEILRRAADYLDETENLDIEPTTDDLIKTIKILEEYLGKSNLEGPVVVSSSSLDTKGEITSGAPCAFGREDSSGETGGGETFQ